MDMEEGKQEDAIVRKSVKNAKWYALRVVAGKERKAMENLEFELDVNNMNKYVANLLLPMEREYKIKNGKKTSRDRLTFPGYLLFEATLIGELPRIVRRTNFIIEFTGDNYGKPAPLRQFEVDRIIGKIEEEKDITNIPYIVGETVDIIDGAFATFKGEITEIDEVKELISLNVTIFGRETPVTLSYLQVDKTTV